MKGGYALGGYLPTAILTQPSQAFARLYRPRETKAAGQYGLDQ